MSTSNVSSCVLNQVRQFQQDFQQFGKDLESGNVSAAQSDYVTLQRELPQVNSTQTAECQSQLSQASNQLAQGVHEGNTPPGAKSWPQNLPGNESARTSTSSGSKSGSLSILA